MKKYYLVTTKHLEDALWFRDDADFATGMNHVAIQAAVTPTVVVLAFILMSNHVHFILYGTENDVATFANRFKGRYSQYLTVRYGIKEFLRRNRLDIKEIPKDETEALERALSYVQMNCVAANICLYPGQYPWGTGNAFFRAAGHGGLTIAGRESLTIAGHEGLTGKFRKTPVIMSGLRKGIRPRLRLGELSGRERVRLMHSEAASVLPDEWLLSDEGFVLPECYVGVEQVEGIFRSPRRMQYFLGSSSKARKRLEAEDEKLPAFRDQVILTALPDLLQSLFQKPAFSALSKTEQAEALRQIRYRFSAGVHQAARVCGLSYADAAQLLECAL